MGDDRVCDCFGVTEEEVRGRVRRGEARTAEAVRRLTGAGERCGRCFPAVERLVENELENTDRKG